MLENIRTDDRESGIDWRTYLGWVLSPKREDCGSRKSTDVPRNLSWPTPFKKSVKANLPSLVSPSTLWQRDTSSSDMDRFGTVIKWFQSIYCKVLLLIRIFCTSFFGILSLLPSGVAVCISLFGFITNLCKSIWNILLIVTLNLFWSEFDETNEGRLDRFYGPWPRIGFCDLTHFYGPWPRIGCP